jgi:hypothetical protein
MMTGVLVGRLVDDRGLGRLRLQHSAFEVIVA